MSSKRKVKLPEIMLFIVAAIVPVIVRVVLVPISPEMAIFHPAPFVEDVFSYHKAWVLTLCAGIIIFHGISDYVINWPDSTELKQKITGLFRNPVIIMVAVYLLFVVASNIFSPYTSTAIWGVHDRREGLLVQLAYITIFLAAMNYVKEKADTRLLLVGFMISSLIMGGIGFSQFINRDFFRTSIASWLVTGGFGGLGPRFVMSYGTNFNPNTFGLVTAMMTPVLIAAACTWSGPNRIYNRIWRGLFLLAGALMAVGIVGSRSVGGLIGAATAITAIVVTLAVRWFMAGREKGDSLNGTDNIKISSLKLIHRKILIVAAIVVAVIIGSGFILRDYIYENLIFTMGRIAAIFEPPNMDHIPDFTFEGNRMSVDIRGVTYHITFPVGQDAVADPTPIVTALLQDTTQGVVPIAPHQIQPVGPPEGLTPEEFPPRHFFVYEIPGHGDITIMNFDNSNIYIYRGIRIQLEDGQIYLLYRGGQLIDPNEPIPTWGFEGWETWGSNRGYIFARTIPLLSQSWLLGSGSDTFLLQFPTHDKLSNYRYFDTPFMLVDKAHNLYLQTAVTTGIISALALIALFGYYIITTFWSLVKGSNRDSDKSPDKNLDKRSNENFWLRLGILASVCAFSISSLSTDSTVSSTPMFWIILGMGFALNKIAAR